MQKGKEEMSKYIFPAVMVCLNLGQAVVMLWRRDFISMTYWIAAAVLNVTVAIK